MDLNIDCQLFLKGKNDFKLEFSEPYLNDDREIIFKNSSLLCKLPNSEIIVNEDKKALEIRSYDKKILISLDNYKAEMQEILSIKKLILKDLSILLKNYKEGNENIIAFNFEEENYPFYITTPTILKNGHYSIKYEKGLEYWIKERAMQLGKKLQFIDFNDLQKRAGMALAKANLKAFKKEKKQNYEYYCISFDELINLL
ncbi:MAG: hypothetical protein K0R54_118 [Clostridiaceae bacterium]|nr:hypothetical protein [Clostridiaceae bacterium]